MNSSTLEEPVLRTESGRPSPGAMFSGILGGLDAHPDLAWAPTAAVGLSLNGNLALSVEEVFSISGLRLSSNNNITFLFGVAELLTGDTTGDVTVDGDVTVEEI